MELELAERKIFSFCLPKPQKINKYMLNGRMAGPGGRNWVGSENCLLYYFCSHFVSRGLPLFFGFTARQPTIRGAMSSTVEGSCM